MFRLAYAFVVATALLFAFPRTRWMGVVGIFCLLAISPVIFSGVLLFSGAGYYLYRQRKKRLATPKALLPPPSEENKGP